MLHIIFYLTLWTFSFNINESLIQDVVSPHCGDQRIRRRCTRRSLPKYLVMTSYLWNVRENTVTWHRWMNDKMKITWPHARNVVSLRILYKFYFNPCYLFKIYFDWYSVFVVVKSTSSVFIIIWLYISFTPVFSRIRVTWSLVLCVMFCRLLLVLLSVYNGTFLSISTTPVLSFFGHCIVCSSSIYRFWLHV